MKSGFIRKHLRRRPRKLLIVGLIIVVLFSPCVVWAILLMADTNRSGSEVLSPALVFGGVWVAGLAATVSGVLGLRRGDSHRYVQALARYGSPGAVVDAIDAELADEANFCIGRPMRSFSLDSWQAGEVHGGQLVLTRSWIVHLWGDDGQHVNVLRLNDLVFAFRRDISPAGGSGGPAASAVFIDRHNVKVEVEGTVGGISRIMAEVLTRVPRALDRFDASTERKWTENPEQIISELERRGTRE